MKENKPLKMVIRMKDPRGWFIPRGMIEELTVGIDDGFAVFYFRDPKITKKFADFEIEMNKKNNFPPNTSYSLRLQKAITKYPDKKKEEIQLIILEQFKKLGMNLK